MVAVVVDTGSGRRDGRGGRRDPFRPARYGERAELSLEFLRVEAGAGRSEVQRGELEVPGAQMVAAWGADSVTWSAQWAPGLDNLVPVRMGATGTEAFAVKDGRGNVTGYYRGQGSNAGLWLSAEYTPEGRVTQKDWVSGATCVETGTTQCPRMGGVPFGFHSAYKSPAHGLLYFRNRWYSAEAGQWLSQDPLGEVDSANPSHV